MGVTEIESHHPGPPGPIVLVGLSGAGKSAVAACLAEILGWTLLDLDAEVERLAGKPVSEVFESAGESEFRRLEAEVTLTSRPDRRTVIATGGGWMVRPELRDSWPGSRRVWLRVDPAVALERLADESFTRPLLAGPEPLAALEMLLASRLPAYELAEYTVETDGRSADEVARAILEELDG